MTPRFSHPLLGTITRDAAGTRLRSVCGARPLAITPSELNEVVAKLETWAEPKFELRVRAPMDSFTPTVGAVVPIDRASDLVAGVARRTNQPRKSFHKHGFSWHLCDGTLALRDGVFLRVLSHTAGALRPWLEECAAQRLQCSFPAIRASGQVSTAPDYSWLEFRDDYVDSAARAAVGPNVVHLDLPLEGGERIRQSVVGFLCAAVDQSSLPLGLSTLSREAASRWLCRIDAPHAPARLASWVLQNGGSEPLARTAAAAEASFGGLRSVDRIQRFGGLQMLERALAEESAAAWPLQQVPEGLAVLMSQRDVDHPDTLACLAEDGRMWRYDFNWDCWTPTSDSAHTFVARVALWGHPSEAPSYVSPSSVGEELARELGLQRVEEASDSRGTFYAGASALVFERHLSEGDVTRMRELRPEAALAWERLAPST